MTPRWRNTSSQRSSPYRNSNFENCPWTRVPFWEPGSPAERSYQPVRARNLRTGSLKRVRRTVTLYPCPTFPKAAKVSTERDPLSLCFLPQEKVRAKWAPTSSVLWNAAEEAHFFLALPRTLRGLAEQGKGEGLVATRAENSKKGWRFY